MVKKSATRWKSMLPSIIASPGGAPIPGTLPPAVHLCIAIGLLVQRIQTSCRTRRRTSTTTTPGRRARPRGSNLVARQIHVHAARGPGTSRRTHSRVVAGSAGQSVHIVVRWREVEVSLLAVVCWCTITRRVLTSRLEAIGAVAVIHAKVCEAVLQSCC
jgi:hypothetical protein